jgi:hypothetical protein
MTMMTRREKQNGKISYLLISRKTVGLPRKMEIRSPRKVPEIHKKVPASHQKTALLPTILVCTIVLLC